MERGPDDLEVTTRQRRRVEAIGTPDLSGPPPPGNGWRRRGSDGFVRRCEASPEHDEGVEGFVDVEVAVKHQ